MLRASYALVQATVGVGTVIIPYIGVAYTRGGGVPCAHALCPCTVPMHCAHALCPCTVPMCPCTVPYPVPMHCAHAWNLGLSSLRRLLQSLLLLPQGLPQGPIRLLTAGQLWLQIRATGPAAHPPSTQPDGNGKPVCIHLLPASFVCAVKTTGQVPKSAKKNGSWN